LRSTLSAQANLMATKIAPNPPRREALRALAL
jgi:hypothetical protein